LHHLCFPSTTPQQFGKFQFVQNPWHILIQSSSVSSVGACKYIGINTFTITAQISFIILHAVDSPMQKQLIFDLLYLTSKNKRFNIIE